MDSGSNEGSQARFAAFVEVLFVVPGHADRPQPTHDYCLGLLMPIERKSGARPLLHCGRPRQSAGKRVPPGRQGRLADYPIRLDFVVLDELSHLPFAQAGGQLPFHLISRLAPVGNRPLPFAGFGTVTGVGSKGGMG